jgi:hypothetical protein
MADPATSALSADYGGVRHRAATRGALEAERRRADHQRLAAAGSASLWMIKLSAVVAVGRHRRLLIKGLRDLVGARRRSRPQRSEDTRAGGRWPSAARPP